MFEIILPIRICCSFPNHNVITEIIAVTHGNKLNKSLNVTIPATMCNIKQKKNTKFVLYFSLKVKRNERSVINIVVSDASPNPAILKRIKLIKLLINIFINIFLLFFKNIIYIEYITCIICIITIFLQSFFILTLN